MIELSNVDFFYKEGNYVFKNFSLSLTDKKKYLLQGKNGTGKTTLLKILLGVLKTKNGKVILEYDKRKTLFIPSTPFYEPYLNLGDFIDFYLKKMIKIPDDKINIDKILTTLSLQDHKNTLCKDLSKGTIQKIIISPLFTDYDWDCLFMDEPFEHLDMDTCSILREKILKSDSLAVLINHKEYILEDNLNVRFERISI